MTPAARGAGLTHPGRRRARNEDAILTDPSGRLWAVADGMGGYDHGDLAADMVIDALLAIGDGDDPARLTERIATANAAIFQRSREPGMGPMGATVVALFLQGGAAHLAWAGDSRGYLWRGGGLAQLTRDHSLVAEMVERGAIRPEEAEAHPEAHVVTRAVGATAEVEVETRSLPLAPGDRLLLCSDGLTRVVSEAKIAAALATGAPEAVCRVLLQAALEAGAPDNVSVIVIDPDLG